MKSSDSFFQGHPSYFHEEVIPVLRTLESTRKVLRGKILLVCGLIGVLIAIALFATPHIPLSFSILIMLPVSMAALVFGLQSYSLSNEYTQQFKSRIIGAIVRFFDKSLHYEPEDCVLESKFVASGLFQTIPDRYQGEDKVHGIIGKTQIEFSEILAEYKSRSLNSDGGSQETWVTIFKGLFFVGDFNKNIKGTTVVLPDVAERLFGGFGKWIQKIQKIGWHPELITLEDPEFEKYFVVYGDDQTEARYILTPNLMERILSFRRRTGQDLYLSFCRQNVYVAISSSDNMFEPRIFQTLWSKQLVKGYVEDMAMAVGVVEELNLNRRIWTKD